MKEKQKDAMSWVVFVVTFSLLYCVNAVILFIGLSILGFILVSIQQLDGPAAGLPALYISFLAAMSFAFPITLIQIFKRGRK